MKFTVPRIWSIAKNHDDYYFGVANLAKRGIWNNAKLIKYPKLALFSVSISNSTQPIPAASTKLSHSTSVFYLCLFIDETKLKLIFIYSSRSFSTVERKLLKIVLIKNLKCQEYKYQEINCWISVEKVS